MKIDLQSTHEKMPYLLQICSLMYYSKAYGYPLMPDTAPRNGKIVGSRKIWPLPSQSFYSSLHGRGQTNLSMFSGNAELWHMVIFLKEKTICV